MGSVLGSVLFSRVLVLTLNQVLSPGIPAGLLVVPVLVVLC